MQGDMVIARSLKLRNMPFLSISADRSHVPGGGQTACSRHRGGFRTCSRSLSSSTVTTFREEGMPGRSLGTPIRISSNAMTGLRHMKCRKPRDGRKIGTGLHAASEECRDMRFSRRKHDRTGSGGATDRPGSLAFFTPRSGVAEISGAAPNRARKFERAHFAC